MFSFFRPRAVAFLTLVGSLSCTRAPEPKTRSAFAAQAAENTPVTQAQPETEKTTASDPADETPPAAPEPAGIEISVADFQLFHPKSRTRALMNPWGGKVDRTKAQNAFGLGLVIDAKNTSEHLLEEVKLIGEAVLRARKGTARCELVPKRFGKGRGPTHLSVVDGGKKVLADESRQTYERAWRPGETLRMVVREDCGDLHLMDMEMQSVHTSFTVSGTVMFEHRRPHMSFPLPDATLVKSDEMRLELPGNAAVLQSISLPGPPSDEAESSDLTAHSAGDIVVYSTAGRVVRTELGLLGIKANAVKRTEVPDTLQNATAKIDELSVTVNAADLTHWADRDGLSKGTRLLELKAQVKIDSAALKARATTDIPESKQDKALSAARSRLVQTLSCGRIILVTTSREIAPRGSSSLDASCKTLYSEDALTLDLNYTLSRYEIPIAIFARSKTGSFYLPIAHKALLQFDPR